MLEATGGTCGWLYIWPRGKVPKPRQGAEGEADGGSKYGLGPVGFALAFGLPPPASLPNRPLPRLPRPGKRQRDGIFYGPLAWKPLTQKERRNAIERDIFGSDSDSESWLYSEL